ncbi:RagB/SusD family nutrient uptake outer membrane protein [Bacteroides sp. CR5/BHMF/2]|nr:RagB/SusD family nutrient uptake outer membrane protein [Bacteroides sp. CR5/BHMF/2]
MEIHQSDTSKSRCSQSGRSISGGSKDPDKMRQLIRRERQIELAFEGYRFFDTRTWRIAEETENGPVYGMNVMATDHTPTGKFWQRTVVETRVFSKKHYLFPIAQEELDRNKAITQNYLW